MVQQVDFDTMVGDMGGKDTLNGWDVLVAYPEDTINQYLSNQASKIGLLETLTFTAKYPSGPPGQTTPYTVTITFDDPTLSFSETPPDYDVALMLPIQSGTWSGAGAQGTFPASTDVVVAATLDNVEGTFDQDSGDWTPSSNPISVRQGKAVDLQPDTGSATQSVVINFSNSAVNVQNQNLTSPELDFYQTLLTCTDSLGDSITQYGLNYYIAAVQAQSSSVSTDSHDVQVVPNKFCFTTVTGSDNIKSTLCMWIGLQGTSSEGQENPSFVLGNTVSTPIPTATNGSIIFSHDAVANLFLTPILKTQFGNVACTSQPGNTGMDFTFNFPSTAQISVPSYEYIESLDRGSIDSIHFTMNDNPIQFNLTNRNLKATYASAIQKTDYSAYTTYMVNGMPTDQGGEGTADITFYMNSTGSWTVPKEGNVDQITFNLPWDPITYNMTPEHQSWWNKLSEGALDWIPNTLKTLNPISGTPTSLAVSSMDYFLVTNLLFPGQKVFTPDAPTGTTGKGLSVPRDLIMTGSLNAPSS